MGCWFLQRMQGTQSDLERLSAALHKGNPSL